MEEPLEEYMNMCITCHYMVRLNQCHHCILAKEKIHDPNMMHYCDFWRLDEGLRLHIHDIYDHDAMERCKQEDDQSLPDEE